MIVDMLADEDVVICRVYEAKLEPRVIGIVLEYMRPAHGSVQI
jgi:hypothetical protein